MHSNEFKWDTKRIERFYFLASIWDVSRAKRLIVRKPRKVENIDCTLLQSWVARPSQDQISCGVTINWNAIDNGSDFDLDFPLILVTLDHDETFVIDGWHRIAKGFVVGRTTLPGVVLDKAETTKVRAR